MCLCCLSLHCVRFLLYSIHSVGQAFRGFLPAAFKTESDPQISHVTHHTGGIIKDSISGWDAERVVGNIVRNVYTSLFATLLPVRGECYDLIRSFKVCLEDKVHLQTLKCTSVCVCVCDHFVTAKGRHLTPCSFAITAFLCSQILVGHFVLTIVVA